MTTTTQINNKREILGWTMYDWGNSAFSTTVVTTFLGPYLTALIDENGMRVFGTDIEGAAFFSFCVSLSVVLQVFFLPILGSMADYSPYKKRMMMAFAYTGAIATMLLFFVSGNLALLGGVLFIFANLSFGAAIVFYNSFLPEIASPDQRDKVSSNGFAMGYLGGGILLALNLVMVNMMEDTGLAVRLSLASAGVWWLLFTYFFPQQRLVQRPASRQLPKGETYFSQGIKGIFTTFRDMRTKYPETLRYLLAYLIYNDGIQTVIAVSTVFMAEELGVETSTLVVLVLLIQFVAFFGAIVFGWLANRIGAKWSIVVSLVIWSGLVIYAYVGLRNPNEIWVLGVVLALVLGGSQALSRSLYSQMIPEDHEAEYFGFYEVSERGTSWLGPLVFAAVVQMVGSQRPALLSLIFFFVVGLLLLIPVNVRKGIIDSGHDPEGVIL